MGAVVSIPSMEYFELINIDSVNRDVVLGNYDDPAITKTITIRSGEKLSFKNYFSTVSYDDTQIFYRDVPKGLVGSGFFFSGGIIQVVQNHTITPVTYTVPTLRTGIEVSTLTTNITTKQSGTRVLFDLTFNFETWENTVFFLTRTVNSVTTEIGSSASAGNRAYGIAITPYDGTVTSTMSNINIRYIDSPNVAMNSVITYKLMAYSPAGSVPLSVNRTITDSDATNMERVPSNVLLWEMT